MIYMIHQFRSNGYNIVLDVCSGSVHVVDDMAYDAIASYNRSDRDGLLDMLCEKYGKDGCSRLDAAECIGQIEGLKASGRLFTKDTFAPMAYEPTAYEKTVFGKDDFDGSYVTCLGLLRVAVDTLLTSPEKTGLKAIVSRILSH